MASDSDFVYEVCDHFVEFAHSNDVRRIDDIMSRFRAHVLADERAVLEAAASIMHKYKVHSIQTTRHGGIRVDSYHDCEDLGPTGRCVEAQTLADAVQKLKEGA